MAGEAGVFGAEAEGVFWLGRWVWWFSLKGCWNGGGDGSGGILFCRKGKGKRAVDGVEGGVGSVDRGVG